MGPQLPYAFSVHHFINSVGADAGFASIIGLAILVLLFFAQARETTSLREQLSQAAERVGALESRLAQSMRSATQPPAAAPAPPDAAAAAQPAQPAQPAQLQPAAAAAMSTAAASPAALRAGATAAPARIGGPPAGVGAPAQGAATRLIPDIAPSAPATAAASALNAPAPPARAPAIPAEANRLPTPAPAPAPVTTAGNGSGAGEAPPRIQIRPGGAPAQARRAPAAPRLVSTRPERRSRGRQLLGALIALAALAGVVVVLLVLTSGGGSSSSSSSSASNSASNAPTGQRSHRGAGTVVPANVTVAVLNGTATSGLAHRVALKVAGRGFKEGAVATATDQTRTATIVGYQPGHRRDALAVAGTLGLGTASVAPVDQTTLAVACPPPAACSATVVVTVGSDLANIQ